jgi:fibro-slime domain-containing protein
MRLRHELSRAIALGSVLAACGGGGHDAGTTGQGGSGGAGGGAQAGTSGKGGSGNSAGSGSGGGSAGGTALPEFTKTELGGILLGPETTGSGYPNSGVSPPSAGETCSVIVGTVRDFKGANEPSGHPDFEAFIGGDATEGLVASELGADRKPVYTGQCEEGATLSASLCPYDAQTTSQANFDQWFRFAADVNQPFVFYIAFAPQGLARIFRSDSFFPLDGAGWGNSLGQDHNFGFTSEFHLTFRYGGGETFEFSGEDDVWIFINGLLAVDLGGTHAALSEIIDLDSSALALGLEVGREYGFDLFQAERHTTDSTLRMETNITFTNCGEVPPDP